MWEDKGDARSGDTHDEGDRSSDSVRSSEVASSSDLFGDQHWETDTVASGSSGNATPTDVFSNLNSNHLTWPAEKMGKGGQLCGVEKEEMRVEDLHNCDERMNGPAVAGSQAQSNSEEECPAFGLEKGNQNSGKQMEVEETEKCHNCPIYNGPNDVGLQTNHYSHENSLGFGPSYFNPLLAEENEDHFMPQGEQTRQPKNGACTPTLGREVSGVQQKHSTSKHKEERAIGTNSVIKETNFQGDGEEAPGETDGTSQTKEGRHNSDQGGYIVVHLQGNSHKVVPTQQSNDGGEDSEGAKAHPKQKDVANTKRKMSSKQGIVENKKGKRVKLKKGEERKKKKEKERQNWSAFCEDFDENHKGTQSSMAPQNVISDNPKTRKKSRELTADGKDNGHSGSDDDNGNQDQRFVSQSTTSSDPISAFTATATIKFKSAHDEAGEIWEIGKQLGVTAPGNEDEIISKLVDLEQRDRKLWVEKRGCDTGCP